MLSFVKFRWVDVIDIIIVATMVFYFLRFLKGTAGLRMLYGLAFLVVVSLVARWLDFKGVGLIVNSLTTLWIVAFVILFQPELRNLLARFGRYQPLRFLLRHGIEKETIEELVEACVQMKERGLGGLIAIERGIGLRQYSDTGNRLESKVTHDLIVSIFTRSSPLHDGAVIIANNLIMAAGCTLPLSDVTFQDGHLGMRHRAGLGVATVADAVAIIVSESSGRISLAHRGRLILDLTPSQLRYNISETLLKEA